MSQRTFTRVVGVVFLLVTVLHVLRLICRWEVVIGGWDVPMWMSSLAVALSGYLAYTAFRLKGT